MTYVNYNMLTLILFKLHYCYDEIMKECFKDIQKLQYMYFFITEEWQNSSTTAKYYNKHTAIKWNNISNDDFGFMQ